MEGRAQHQELVPVALMVAVTARFRVCFKPQSANAAFLCLFKVLYCNYYLIIAPPVVSHVSSVFPGQTLTMFAKNSHRQL